MVAIEANLVESNMEPNEHLAQLLKSNPKLRLEVACYNGPNSYVVAGTTPDIEALASLLSLGKPSEKTLRYKVLRGMHAYHSVMADSIIDESARLSASIPFQVSDLVSMSDSSHPYTCFSYPIHHPFAPSPLVWFDSKGFILTMARLVEPRHCFRVLPQRFMDWAWAQCDRSQHA